MGYGECMGSRYRLKKPLPETHRMCPACGYAPLTFYCGSVPPWENVLPSFGRCPCCDFDFEAHYCNHGYSPQEWREQWIAVGMPWCDDSSNKRRYNPKVQLERVRKHETSA